MRIVVTGGGSAGHVMPALAVADVLTTRGAEVSFIGSRSGLEERLVEPARLPYYGIAAGKLRRYLSLENLTDVFRVVLGIWQAWRLLGRLRPDAVFSKGGYVALPVVVAAWLRRVPVVAHESDFTPGLANRLTLPMIRALAVSFAQTEVPNFSGALVHTGSPIRRALLEGEAEAGLARLGLDRSRPVLLVVGGSLGAESLNRVVAEGLRALLDHWQVVHVHGEVETPPDPQPGYVPLPFVAEGWGDVLAAADLVVSRAGANALFELLALGKLNLLVPLPATASRGDQIENAAYAAAEGFSTVVRDGELSGERLLAATLELWERRAEVHNQLRRFEAPDAVTRIADLVTAQIS